MQLTQLLGRLWAWTPTTTANGILRTSTTRRWPQRSSSAQERTTWPLPKGNAAPSCDWLGHAELLKTRSGSPTDIEAPRTAVGCHLQRRQGLSRYAVPPLARPTVRPVRDDGRSGGDQDELRCSLPGSPAAAHIARPELVVARELVAAKPLLPRPLFRSPQTSPPQTPPPQIPPQTPPPQAPPHQPCRPPTQSRRIKRRASTCREEAARALEEAPPLRLDRRREGSGQACELSVRADLSGPDEWLRRLCSPRRAESDEFFVMRVSRS